MTLAASLAHAQGTTERGAVAVELVAGHAGFVDDATIHHGLVGGALRWHVSPRASVGPEVVYMRGPGDQRNLMATGNVTFDVFSPARTRRWTPFVVAGAGLFRHSDRFGSQSFSSSEGAFTIGAGARASLGERWFVGGEWRFGWELHTRVNGIIGVRLAR